MRMIIIHFYFFHIQMKIKFTIFIFFIVSEISFAAEVNLYTSRHYDTDESLYDFFTKETGIEVNVISAKGNALIEKIKAEGSNTSADVFITVDAGNLWTVSYTHLTLPTSR